MSMRGGDLIMIWLLEMIGTIAFAISGAFAGIQKKMDVFGVAMLAMTTAVGGGIIRDMILNVTPPAAFREPVFTIAAILTGIAVFFIVRQHFHPHKQALYEALLRTMDAVGLGIFTVIGVEAAYVHVEDPNVYLAVFVGVITGVGGGIMRDVFSGTTPYVFTKHFYACASLIGAIVCAVCWPRLGSVISMLIGAVLILVLRNLASYYHWSLPKIS